jgi:uncharacterized repeat protein (TIGR02543 family)
VGAYQLGTSSQSLTLFSNLSPSFSNPGYTFSGWNTQSDGLGTSYANGATYSFTSDMELYAQWTKEVVQTAFFEDNGGVGTISSTSGYSGSVIQLPGATGIINNGYSFSGWNTEPDGMGIDYPAGSSIVLLSNLILYAQWSPDVYVVSYQGDGGTVNPGSVTFATGNSPIILPNPVLTDNTFDGWYSEPTGGLLVGLAGASYEPVDSVSLYAQWSPLAKITISFATNGGSGSVPLLGGLEGSTVTLPTSSNLIRSGFKLTSWNTEANGSGTSFALGKSVTLNNSITLFAQWKAIKSTHLYGVVNGFSMKPSILNVRLKAQMRRLATVIRRRDYSKVTLYGYSYETGKRSRDAALSLKFAKTVAHYLRVELSSLRIRGIKILLAGEGAIVGKTSPAYSRVEVFVD